MRTSKSPLRGNVRVTEPVAMPHPALAIRSRRLVGGFPIRPISLRPRMTATASPQVRRNTGSPTATVAPSVGVARQVRVVSLGRSVNRLADWASARPMSHPRSKVGVQVVVKSTPKGQSLHGRAVGLGSAAAGFPQDPLGGEGGEAVVPAGRADLDRVG